MKEPSKKSKKHIGHVVSHTHWDREWRYPIWETRLMLVDFVDELIEVLESGKYPGFLMDGQVSPILDYLDIRPEMTARVKKLVAGGKLQIGPWLTLPDEYPIDGEALVRNLLWGRRRSEALGAVFNVGYTPFGWGQTAQLAQLYAGFGMDVAMIGKRVNNKRAPKSEFIWRAPDGTELLSTRFGELGRQNFYFIVHLSALFGTAHLGPGWRYEWSKGGVAYHRADREQMEQDHFFLDAPNKWYSETITPEMCDAAWHTTDESVLENDRLMMNGCDYTASQPMFPEMLKKLNEVDPDPNREWIHTTMPEFVELMRRKIDRSKLAIVEGELRDGPSGPVTGNALTTRLYLKRLNKHAQNMLIRFAEPFSVAAAMLGAPYQEPLLRKAWEFLLSSHPHDSINGVTQDKTVSDVSDRLNQVIDLSQTLGNRAMQEFVTRMDLSKLHDSDVAIIVFNPLPYARREVVEAWVNMPETPGGLNWPNPPNEPQMFDTQARAVATQWQGRTSELYCVAEIHTRAFPFHCQRHRVFFDAGEIPACGYKVFRVGSMNEAHGKGVAWSDSQARTGTLLKAPNVLENEFLRVEMNTNGTFDLTDNRLKKTFAGMNYFEDRGEHGDYWINQRPMQDQVHSSQGCTARIWCEESGPLQATLVSELTMLLPRRGNKEKQCRGDELAPLTIRTAVTLRAGGEQVDVAVSFENRHEDHFLRVLFPTGLDKAKYADAGGHFIVDRRPIRPQGPSTDAVWPDMGTLPQNNFVDVSDGQIGVAFLNDGLTEYEVMDNDERTVALSLIRAVRNWVCTEMRCGSDWPSQKGGQCLGTHTIRYAIRPHKGDWATADIPLAAERFNVAVRLVQTRQHKGSLPGDAFSFLAIDNTALRFSGLKKAEDRDSCILRLYNPTSKTQAGRIRFATKMKKAWAVNLNEDRQGEIKLADGNVLPVKIGPYKIATFEVSGNPIG